MVEQLAASRLVHAAFVHAATQDVQLGLAESAFQSKQEPIVVVGRIVETVLVGQEGFEDGADFEQLMPVLVGACQSAHLQTEDDADLSEGDGGEQTLEPPSGHGGLTTLALILVDDLDSGTRPAQGHGLLDEGVLARGGLLVIVDLLQRGLANVDESLTLEMSGANLEGTE